MNDVHSRSSSRIAIDIPCAPDALLARILLGVLCVAVVAVASLPQARAASDVFGWMPLWLIAMPSSAWLALQARRRAMRPDAGVVPARHRRRVVVPAQWRAAVVARGRGRRVRVARAG